jgi:lysophospholipase L1-like esterase
MRRRCLLVAMISGLGAVQLIAAAGDTLSPASRWESEIRAFEAFDRSNPPPQNAVLFLGSSSIRLWTNLAQSFPGHKVLNRGFGGSQLSDSAALVERLVLPYKPKLVLLYAGDNDIAGGKSPEQVFADFKTFVQRVHSAIPMMRIGFISIKPSPVRTQYLAQVRAANKLVGDYAASNPKLLFIDVFTALLDQDGRPKAELYRQDGLHLNPAGYAIWSSILKPVVDQFDRPE